MAYVTLRKSFGPLSGGTRVEIAPNQDGAGKGHTLVRLNHVSESLRNQNKTSQWSFILGAFEVPTADLVFHHLYKFHKAVGRAD